MNCTLRKWRLSDAAALLNIPADKRILDNLRDGIPCPYTQKDAEEYINAVMNADEKDAFVFAIEVDGKVVGNVGAFRQKDVHRLSAEIGFYLSTAYWGKGIMTDAVKQLCDVIWEKSDIVRIFALVYETNPASCRVLEKAGFVREGTLKRSAVKNGRILDTRLYALVKE